MQASLNSMTLIKIAPILIQIVRFFFVSLGAITLRYFFRHSKSIFSHWAANAFFVLLIISSALSFHVKAQDENVAYFENLAELDQQQAVLALRGRYPFKLYSPIEQLALLSLYSNMLLRSEKNDELAQVIEQYILVAKQQSDVNQTLKATAVKVVLLRKQHKVDEMLIVAEELLQQIDHNVSDETQYTIYTMLGRSFAATQKLEQALSLFNKALVLINDNPPLQEKKSKASVLTNLTVLNINLKNWADALSSVNTAIELAETEKLNYLLINLYLNKAYVLTELHLIDEAITVNLKAVELANKFNQLGNKLYALNSLADSYMRKHRFKDSLTVIAQATTLAKSQNAGEILSVIESTKLMVQLFQTGDLKILSKINAVAEQYVDKGFYTEAAFLYKDIVNALALHQQYKKQIGYMQKRLEVNDKIFHSERANALAQLEEQHQVKEKIKQIALLQQREQLNKAKLASSEYKRYFILVVMLLVCLLFIIYVIFNRHNKANQRKLMTLNTQLSEQLIRDPLTGLYNRRALTKFAKKSFVRPVGLFIIDIDHFKSINDSFGHNGGDQVLIEVAKRMQNTLREGDKVLRWGGEEFLLLINSVSTQTELGHLAQRVLNNIAQSPTVYESHEIFCSVSIGYISLPFAGYDIAEFGYEEAIQWADAALYMSKEHGRNKAYGVTDIIKPERNNVKQLVKNFQQSYEEEKINVELKLGVPIKLSD
jgi:diguanylate cyclase (GGDEF)-like protein